MVKGMPKLSLSYDDACKGCAMGKNVKNPFHKSDSRAKERLEFIHSDLCGPMSVASPNGFLHYVIFIDDFSRKTWIYFLKSKESEEVLNRFKEFKALVENTTGNRIKCLRSDNGGEYTSSIFYDFCIKVGIKREFCVPYNPQQNGVAERKNRTIVEVARAMIHDQDLQPFLWAEASKTTVYIQNRCPHRALKDVTPEEAFTGIKPDINHLRIFGSPMYVHVPKEKRTKLDPSGKKGILVGYNESSKAFRIYISGQRYVEVSRDVTFEDIAFKRSKGSLSNNNDMEIENQDSIVDANPEIQEEPTDLPDRVVQNDSLETMLPTDIPQDIVVCKKRPLWVRNTIQDAKGFAAPRGTFRDSKRFQNHVNYIFVMCNIIESEPHNVEEAMSHYAWKLAMDEEYGSIIKNDVWDIVPRPKGKSVVSSKWLFKIKHNADGSIEKYKARFVARGFSQKKGIDYEETFAPVVRYTSIRSIIAIAVAKGWELHQMDVKTTFLNGVIEEEVYIEQPEGYVIHKRDSHVCRLKKALYGLKQAPRAWYERIDKYLLSLGFCKNDADANIYLKVYNDEMLILVLYVDDLFLTGESKLIIRCKKELASKFEMKDLGLMHYFLGLEVWQRSNEIFLSQVKYTIDILKRFRMIDCKPMHTPMESNLKKLSVSATNSDFADPSEYRQLIGSLMYLVNTRSDICYAVNALSQFTSLPKLVHLVAAKHILRYLRGTIGYGLKYSLNTSILLEGYSDSDWAGSVKDRKSTSGICFNLGSAVISWACRKQSSVALSTAEVEYIAASIASREAVWLHKLLVGLFGQASGPTTIHCNNQAV
ncbi:retrovirus-related Pol polyprotein from transposon TNT 1-94 isoform X1 [Cryptomeria japonica]|uniref:retrovirus-related Pol polyprotein from transposon TNT 1-94 isoform X1 n=1 Tax=Cryptomeria japonica TaxID=3369 RepID=UPI0027DA7EE3|nr:retrovirus-related Pol polyprotein from transposon TNT 1-94 isoform X1 [Cryptomeria japonica]